MKKVQRMLNFHTYKRLFCANFYVIVNFYSLNVTQEGTDVNGFWANGQPMKIM